MLQVHEVSHRYGKRSWLDRSESRPSVLEDVSLTIEEGVCLGLLGTSGAGKSTLGKVILGLERPSQGQVLFQGQDIYRADKTVLKGLRRDLQVVFQDCYSAVNPMMTAAQIIGEPLDNYERLSAKEQQRTIERVCSCRSDLHRRMRASFRISSAEGNCNGSISPEPLPLSRS